MTPPVAAFWGLLGGAVVEAFDTADVMRRTGTWPWRTLARARPVGVRVWLVSLVVRLGAGAATAAAAGAGGLYGNAIGAFAIGAAGPVALQAIIARTSVAAAVPVPNREPGRVPATSEDQLTRAVLEEVPDET
jgi:hypothetical protein